MSQHPVTIKPEWAPGSRQVITFPGGQQVAIVVPPNVQPGQQIMVQAPVPPPAEMGDRLEIVVPAGSAPGSKVEFPLPDGRMMSAIVPDGARPGQRIVVVVPRAGAGAGGGAAEPPPPHIPLPDPEPAPAPAPELSPPPAVEEPEPEPEPSPAPEISIRHSDSDSTMPVLNTEVVALRSGYLDKKGDIRKNWKKRWFVLQTDGTLPYYKNETAADRGEEPLGVIAIGAQGLNVAGGEAVAASAGRAHAFRLYQPGGSRNEYVLAGADQATTNLWISTIERRYQLTREHELGLTDGGGSAFAMASAGATVTVESDGGGGGALSEALLVSADGEDAAQPAEREIDIVLKPWILPITVSTAMPIGELKAKIASLQEVHRPHPHPHPPPPPPPPSEAAGITTHADLICCARRFRRSCSG